MDENNVEKIKLMATSEGVAGLWLANHVPAADRAMQVSLGTIIDAMVAEGMRKGKLDAIKALGLTPTVSAARASLEADIVELERAINKKRDEGIDFDVLSV